MANTIMGGLPTHDPSSDWAQFDFSIQPDYPSTISGLHTTGPLSNYPQHDWNAYNPDMQPRLLNARQHTFPPHAFVKSAPEFSSPEGGSSTRLTQEQMAALESSYREMPKPKPKERRSLAGKLGIDFHRVDYWYQNRRQKAKSKRYSGRSASDGKSTAVPATSVSMAMSMPPSEALNSTNAFSEGQSLHDPGISSYNFNMDPHNAYNPVLHHQPSRSSHASGSIFDNNTTSRQSPAFQHSSAENSEWLPGLSLSDALHEPMDPGSSSMTSRSLSASHNFPAGIHARDSEFLNPSPLNYKVSGSALLNNESTQTLHSNASSVGDSNSLMTSPDSTHPLPWLSSSYDDRRTSDSSELAHNVEGMHLQHGPPGLSLVTNSLGPSPQSSMVSLTGIATPETSPEQVSSRPYGPPPDLASRRKGSRPTALRPDASRNSSNSAPLSQSPHSRNASVSAAPPGPPRRTQSSGQVLHNQFRVHKPSLGHAQVSPRNLQAHFDKNPLSQGQGKSATNSNSASPTIHPRDLNRPSASAASANRSPAEYQHEFHVISASSSHGTNALFQPFRHANSSVPNLSSSGPQAHAPLSIHVPTQQNMQLLSHHGPPQSAPPQQTSFFEDSPSSDNGPFAPPGSQAHAFAQSRPNDLAFGSNLVQQPIHFTPPGQGYLPPFAPRYDFPDNSHMAGYPVHGFLPSYPPGPLNLTPTPSVELDIKVELGPQPKLSQRFEKCEFQNTFSNNWGQSGDKK